MPKQEILIPEELYQKAKEAAEQVGVTIEEWIESALTERKESDNAAVED